MLKAYKFVIRPTTEQITLIEKHFGACRFVYNYFIDQSKDKVMKKSDMQKMLVGLKAEKEWLNEINSQSLQVATHNLYNAYGRFFKKLGGYPKFKSRKDSYQSFSIPQNVEIKENRLFIPKFKKNGIRVKLHRQIPAGLIIKQATLSRHNAKYFISVLIDDQQELRNKVQPVNSVGIDMGLSQLYIFSNGEKIDNPKWLRASERRLTKAQRILSRKKLGSQNRGKAKLRLQKLHTKISNQRRDYIHKMTDAITKQFDIICIETLAIKNMIQNLHLSKSIQDASWNEFARQLAYKAQWKGKYFVQINRYYPSSKTCSVCGHYRKDMPLQIRSWTCSECHTKHDRDVNAAINIERQGLSSLPVEVTRLLAPMKQEAAAVLAYPT